MYEVWIRQTFDKPGDFKFLTTANIKDGLLSMYFAPETKNICVKILMKSEQVHLIKARKAPFKLVYHKELVDEIITLNKVVDAADGPFPEESLEWGFVKMSFTYLMTFELWQNGQFVKYITVQDVSEEAAISKLSDQHKGVFKRVPVQEMHEPMKEQLVGEL